MLKVSQSESFGLTIAGQTIISLLSDPERTKKLVEVIRTA
jgi:hypothetical protein